MSATELKQRMRAHLKAAMQARASDEVRLLRTLIAALDNAEAVDGEGVQDHFNPRTLGDPRGEVARREIDAAELETILAEEAATRLAAAEDYDRHGRHEDAERLRCEVALIDRYRAS